MGAKGKGGGRKPNAQADAVLLAALAAGDSHRVAAEKANVSETTVRRRLEDPAFSRDLAAIQAGMIDQAASKAAWSCISAIEKLASLMLSTDETIALRAAVALLDQAVKLRDSQALLKRLAELEAMVDQLLSERSDP